MTARARSRTSLPSLAYAATLAGLVLLVGLVARQGVGEIFAMLALAGPGLLVVAAFHCVPLAADAVAWRSLLPGAPLPTLLRARWIAESINSLLPVAQIGGNVARATLLVRRGESAARAGASVVVDITMNLAAQMVFTMLGLTLLLLQVGPRRLAWPVVVGMLVMGGLYFGFYLSQRRGIFGAAAGLLGRLSAGMARGGIVTSAAALDRAVADSYGRRTALLGAAAWHLASWMLGAGEIWLALYFLGQPVDLATALLIESLGAALRSAAFIVPGALGIQEGGLMLIGGAFGVEPSAALALSLAKRARELLLGLPGIAAWLWDGAFRAAAAGAPRSDDVGVLDR